MRRLVACFLSLLLLGSLAVTRSSSEVRALGSVERLGQAVLGYASVIYAAGARTYAGFGSAVVVLDTSNPGHPVERGRAFLTNCLDGKAGFGRDRLYVPRDIYGLGVLDVSDPDHPRVVAEIYDPGPDQRHTSGGVQVAGGYAYWANNHANGTGSRGRGLSILDADPASPGFLDEVGAYKSPEIDFALGVHVEGDTAYLCTRSTGVYVLDVSNRTAPALIARVPTNFAIDMAVSGGYGFLADGSFGLKVIDLASYQVTSYVPPGSSVATLFYRSLAIRGTTLYAASALRGIDVLDISVPANPVLVKNIPKVSDSAYPVQLSLSGDDLYAAFLLGGVRVYSLSDPRNPALVGTQARIDTARDVAVLDGYAYVAYGERGLAVVDVSTPEVTPLPEAVHDINSGSAQTQAVFALPGTDRLYVADGTEGLKVFRIAADPLRDPPELLWRFGQPVDVRDVQVVEDGSVRTAYLADFDHSRGGLWVVDVTGAGEPGFAPSPRYVHGIGSAVRLFQQGEWVYVASNGPAVGCTSYNGLRVVDLKTDPPQVRAWAQTDFGNISDVDAAEINGRAYVFAATHGGPSPIPGVICPPPSLLHILENLGGSLSKRTAVEFRGCYFGESLAAVHVSGRKAYVNHTNTGIYVYDVNDPLDPVREAHYPLTCNNSASEIRLVGDTIYDAHGDSGLYLFRFLP